MYLAIDLGGTNIRGTWMSAKGRSGPISMQERPKTLDGTKQALKALVEEIVSAAPEKLKGIGLASAGPMERRRQRYLHPSNMPELHGFEVGMFLTDISGLPVIMENDAQAAALGEFWMGCLRGADRGLVLTLGTGVGSGVIMDGKVWRADYETGPELGHMYLGPGLKVRCGCGQVGCAETWLRKSALEDLLKGQGVKFADLRDAAAKLEAGDEGAKRALKMYGFRLGLYVTTLQVVFGFENIGLSGGMSSFFPHFIGACWKTIEHRFVERSWFKPERIVASPSPDMSALWGMAAAWVGLKGPGG